GRFGPLTRGRNLPKMGLTAGQTSPKIGGRCARSGGAGGAFVQSDLVAVRVGDAGEPTGVTNRRLIHQHRTALLAHSREGVIDRVDLDIGTRMSEALAARCQTTPTDLIRRLPHRIALEAGVLLELPSEQGAVKGLGPVGVAD